MYVNSISVTAPCNGSGKTSLILAILRSYPQTFAVTKFTTIYREEQFCPAKDHDCACHRLQGDYAICSDQVVLSQPDTDTGKIWRAGALQTLWCVARPEGYPQMVQEYLERHLKPDVPLLMEGNTITQHLKPQLRLFVVNPRLPQSWWKDDSEEQLRAADFVVLNPYSGVNEHSIPLESSKALEALEPVREKFVSMEVDNELRQWGDGRVYRAITELLDPRRPPFNNEEDGLDTHPVDALLDIHREFADAPAKCSIDLEAKR
jgi:hypothetical protein